MKKITLLCISLALSVGIMVAGNTPSSPAKAPKSNLTEMVITHVTEHGILTTQELAYFTEIYRNVSAQKSALNKETRALKKELKSCTDSNKAISLIQQIAANDLKRAQLDKNAIDEYIANIDAGRLAQVLQCSEKYKNELFKNMRMKRHEMKEKKGNK